MHRFRTLFTALAVGVLLHFATDDLQVLPAQERNADEKATADASGQLEVRSSALPDGKPPDDESEKDSLAERLARLTGAGRKTEKQRDPEGYKEFELEVEQAIRRGAAWLKERPRIDALDLQDEYPTIAILALVHAGELRRDPDLAERCIDYLLRRPLNTPKGTYATALTAMALQAIDRYRYRDRIFECARWLVENQGWGDSNRKVWGYGQPVSGIGGKKATDAAGGNASKSPSIGRSRGEVLLKVVRQDLVQDPRGDWDNSNTQFAVLGLHTSTIAGIKIPRQSWRRVDLHFRKEQNADGGWGYEAGGSYGSMTCAGVASLVAARHHLGSKRPTLDPSVADGLEWLAEHFTVEENPRNGRQEWTHKFQYYYLYGLERVGVLAGTEFIREHEWYPLGARYLLGEQRLDGSWSSEKRPTSESVSNDYLDTCYAILFLRRATLPLEPQLPALLTVKHESGGRTDTFTPAVELILDSSGSMREKVNGRPKHRIARGVVDEILKDLPQEIRLGLRLFGHRGRWLSRKYDPDAPPLARDDPRLNTDSELVVRIDPLTDQHRGKIKQWLDAVEPQGKTPLVYSLLEARNDFPVGRKAPKTIVLVSDGKETAGGDLEDVAEAYRGSGIDLVIHVVGFDIEGGEAERQLRRIAEIGGGNYYAADKGAQLGEALRSAIPNARYEVLDLGGSTVLGRGEVNGDPVALKPGRRRVRLVGASSDAVTVELAPGKLLELTLDDAGELRAPADALESQQLK